MTRVLVRAYYATFGENEWQRLTWPAGAIEFAVTTRALERHLPRAGRVLDVRSLGILHKSRWRQSTDVC